MEIVPTELYIIGLWIALAIQALIGWLFRKKMAGLFDLIFLNSLYVSFGISGLLLVFYINESEKILFEIILICTWLIGMFIGGKITIPRVCPSKIDTQRLDHSRNILLNDWAALGVVSTIYLSYTSQIISSGILFLDSSLIDSRFIVQDSNKIQAYLFGAIGLTPAALLFRINPKLNFFPFFVAITPFWIIQSLTLSKTGFIFPVIAIAIYFSLRIKSGYIKRPPLITQIKILTLLTGCVYLVFYFISILINDSETSALDILLNRLLSSFDGLVYLTKISFKEEGDLSLFQWYFSPFLKTIGLFDQKYNAFNYVIAVEYFKLSSDHAGMLPNNNHIGEIIVTYPIEFRYFIAFFSGLAYGSILSWAYRILKRGSILLIPAAFIASTPLGFLIDGQGWFIALLCSFILIIPTFLYKKTINTLIRIKHKLTLSTKTNFRKIQANE